MANQKSGIFGWKLEGSHSQFIVILKYSIENETINNSHMISCSLVDLLGIRIIIDNLEILTKEASLKTEMVEPIWAVVLILGFCCM